MARKAAHLTMKAGKPTGRQAVWEKARELRTFTLNDLWHGTKQEKATIRTYLTSLHRGGYVKECGTRPAGNGQFSAKSRNPVPATVYKLANDVGVEAPRLRRDGTICVQGAVREQMWRTMKRLSDFTFRDLAVMATTEISPVAEVDARDYVKHLAKAGYLAVVEPATNRKLARYRFIRARDTGPMPPLVQRLQSVFDANLCKVMWQEGGGE